MGFSLTWIGLKGVASDEACARLDVEPTQEYEQFPESALTGVEHDGWFFLIGHDPYEVELAQYDFAKISRGYELVWCAVVESVMYSFAGGWKNGRRIWSVEHESTKGTSHIRPWGDFPPEYQAIRDEFCEKQEGEDEDNPEIDHVFEIPVELADRLTGFRYDRAIAGDSAAYEKLNFRTLPSEAKKAGGFTKWIKGLLGK